MTDTVNTKPEKIYVKVTSDFDAAGFMLPRTIIWGDGRRFPIQRVRDFRPAQDGHGDCYTVIVQGRERLLFFERTEPRFAGRFGRWFVEAERG